MEQGIQDSIALTQSRELSRSCVYCRGKGEKAIILGVLHTHQVRSRRVGVAPKAKPELTFFGLALRRIMKKTWDTTLSTPPRGLNEGKGITATPLKPYLRKKT